MLTSKERVALTLQRKATDRIPVYEHFWSETLTKWRKEGHLGLEEDPCEHFGLDFWSSWPLCLDANLDAPETIMQETAETKLIRNGNGATLRVWKTKSGTPEHVDFEVKDRTGWERLIRPQLTDKRLFDRRIDPNGGTPYARARQKGQELDKFFCTFGVNVFESMHPVCGHEYLLMGMALDPEWIRDMAQVYSDLVLNLLDQLFRRDGLPDGLWFYEDMGFKERPFMSPQMYHELVWPAHLRTIQFAHERHLPVIMHSCGYMEPFIPDLIAAGLDCLQALEVKAGMDAIKLKRLFGKSLVLFGGLDIRVLETNDRSTIEAYLKKMIPVLKEGGGYILHTDHSIPATVKYDTYKFFLETALSLGMY